MFKEREKNLILKLPFGFRDIFPVEAHERKEIEDILRSEFLGWGYGEVKTPVVEFTENLSAGAGQGWKDKLISFFDNDGNIISLRSDMTVPIARLAGMRLKKEQLPARFFYFANSFRQSDIQKGRKRVVSQAGLEFIGSGGFTSDIEILSILMNILSSLKISDFRVAIGNILFVEGMSEWLGFDSAGFKTLRSGLLKKDLVLLEHLLAETEKEKTKLFFELIKPSEDIKELKKLCSRSGNKKMISSFDYIAEIHDMCVSAGFSANLIIDLGIVRDFDYYSGMIFEAYCPRITELLGSGGSYDGLVKKFGLSVSGTGFALDMDILHKALKDSYTYSDVSKKKIILISETKDCRNALKLAGDLRKKGHLVELFFAGHEDPKELCCLRKAGFVYIADFNNKEAEVLEFSNDYKSVNTKRIKLEIGK
ncbi:MAG: ATP phosphoribosyltransferase regulatory subunit [Actinobacteria bacterium ADurb.Bin346]|nr:MAG: ATP phosphoribosyltransferase regulatory subunit [Actinobacteria bacterium ADurb.Bin346]